MGKGNNTYIKWKVGNVWKMEEIAYDEKTVINNMRSLVDLKGKECSN